jgi:hypothetical protein
MIKLLPQSIPLAWHGIRSLTAHCCRRSGWRKAWSWRCEVAGEQASDPRQDKQQGERGSHRTGSSGPRGPPHVQVNQRSGEHHHPPRRGGGDHGPPPHPGQVGPSPARTVTRQLRPQPAPPSSCPSGHSRRSVETPDDFTRPRRGGDRVAGERC